MPTLRREGEIKLRAKVRASDLRRSGTYLELENAYWESLEIFLPGDLVGDFPAGQEVEVTVTAVPAASPSPREQWPACPCCKAGRGDYCDHEMGCSGCNRRLAPEPEPSATRVTTVPAERPTVPRGHCNRCDRCGWMIENALGACRDGDCSTRPLPPYRATCAGCGAPYVDPTTPSDTGERGNPACAEKCGIACGATKVHSGDHGQWFPAGGRHWCSKACADAQRRADRPVPTPPPKEPRE